jgi:hypothetical protein
MVECERGHSFSKGKFALILLLGFISLGLSAYGYYATTRQPSVPRVLQWGADVEQALPPGRGKVKHCNVVVDTAPISGDKDDYYILLACGIVDPTIDQVEDTRILLSGTFNIQGGPQPISAPSNPEFDKLYASLPDLNVPMWIKVFLIPKDRNVTEIHKLSDITKIKGKLFQ